MLSTLVASVGIGTTVASGSEPILQAIVSLFMVIISVGILLSPTWSVEVKCITQLKRVEDISMAEVAKVVPLPQQGKSELCNILSSDGVKGKYLYLKFQEIKMIYDSLTKTFKPPEYITEKEISWYLNNAGLSNEVDVKEAKQRFGANDLIIPVPSFGALFVEHATAPFFVFQVFCVSLWLMDEYWYFSVFTLFMVVVFEVTVVKQRQRNLRQLRSMRRKPVFVHVFRGRKWQNVISTELVPGDIISVRSFAPIQSPKKRRLQRKNKVKINGTAPCDLLLLQGRCIVSEALLTGESVPLMKEGISAGFAVGELKAKDVLNIAVSNNSLSTENKHETNDSDATRFNDRDTARFRKFIVWAGTDVIQFFPERLNLDSSASSANKLLQNISNISSTR